MSALAGAGAPQQRVPVPPRVLVERVPTLELRLPAWDRSEGVVCWRKFAVSAVVFGASFRRWRARQPDPPCPMVSAPPIDVTSRASRRLGVNRSEGLRVSKVKGFSRAFAPMRSRRRMRFLRRDD